jgi:hypothetical protein
MTRAPIRDHFLPPDSEAFRHGPPGGRVLVIAPTRAACETIELALQLTVATVLERDHGAEIRALAGGAAGFGIVAGTGTGKTLAIRPIAENILRAPLRVGVVNREREATPETPSWNVVVVTTGIARRWFQEELITRRDTVIVDEIHQTSAELELCLALGKRAGCRFIWLSATVDPAFYARYLVSSDVLETTAFDPALAARVSTRNAAPLEFLDDGFIRRVIRDKRGVAVFVPTRAEVEEIAGDLGRRWNRLTVAFYHGGEPIRVIRPFLEGAPRPFVLAMTAAGQSALNIPGLDTVVIHDARYANVVMRGRNVLTRKYLGPNEILQMAGRVHGRVKNGEVTILTDRQLHFSSLRPVPPEFQLAGDSERVALTAAALGIDLSQLELPVPVDQDAYREAVRVLTERGIVANGRLTRYGRDVEALPVDRAWAELLVHASDAQVPFVAVAANVDSLHRMTRDERNLRGLIVDGSDHLTANNIYADATHRFGTMGAVFGLPRHLFDEAIEEWCEQRGVLLKALEDIALGTASVYRALDRALPEHMPHADKAVAESFRDLVARVMPFTLSVEERLANGDEVRLSRGSLCSPGVVAGNVRYFADRFGEPRAAIEGTNVPYDLLRRYAKKGAATVVYRRSKRHEGLYVEQAMEYYGFFLEQSRQSIVEPFPAEWAEAAHAALARAALAGETTHRDAQRLRQAAESLDEYWRRSAGALPAVSPEGRAALIRPLLAAVETLPQFLATRLTLDVDAVLAPADRVKLDALPSMVELNGIRAALEYEMEGARGVVSVQLKEAQVKRLRARDIPEFDRPVRFCVRERRGPRLRSESIDGLRQQLHDQRRRQQRRRAR